MKQLILLKIGGGVITDKKVRYGLKEDILLRLAQEIAEGWKGLKDTELIIGNGAGSFAHFSAHKYRTAEGFVDEDSRIGMGWVRWDAVKLNQIVFEQLLLAGVPVFSFAPSSMTQVEKGITTNLFAEPMQDAMEKGMVPLVYGDPIVDRVTGCGIYSTEKVFDDLTRYFVKKYKVRVIHINVEEGVYKAENKEIIPEITKVDFGEVRKYLQGSGGVDVTGGMLHKVEECLELAKLGVVSQIVSGVIPERVRDVILGTDVKGTKIL